MMVEDGPQTLDQPQRLISIGRKHVNRLEPTLASKISGVPHSATKAWGAWYG